MSGADMSGAKMSGAEMSGAKMPGAETARRRVVQRRMGGAERVLPLELYCVGLLTLLRGTLDWIELAMLSPIDENK